MWPNSCLPSATALITAAYVGAGGRFTLEGVENHASREYNMPISMLFSDLLSDYPRTLRTWDRRLKDNLKQEVITKSYPSLADPAEYATFKRKWEYMYVYAEVGYARAYTSMHYFTFVRPVRPCSMLRGQRLIDIASRRTHGRDAIEHIRALLP